MGDLPDPVVEILALIRAGNERILEPLLTKITRIANELEEEREVPGEEIRATLAVWSQYLLGVRGERIRAAIGRFPVAQNGSSCGTRIRELRDQLSAESARVPAIERILGSFESGHFGGRGTVVGLLRGGVASDRAWARFEEEYVAHCLTQPPAPSTMEEVQIALARVRSEIERLAGEVQSLVEPKPEAENEPLPVPA